MARADGRETADRHRLSRPLSWIFVGLWAAAIFTVSSIPGTDLPGGYSWQGHLIEYAVLGSLLFLALRHDHPPLRAALLAVAIASAYGVTDEIHQSFVPNRMPDPLDWLTDTAGASVAIGAWLYFSGYRVHTKRSSRQ